LGFNYSTALLVNIERTRKIMLKIRKSEERGHVQFTWLDTRHSFSFGSYYDPSFMGFRNLRVINEDKIVPGRGFPTHGHQDM